MNYDCSSCQDLLDKEGIVSQNVFRKWSLKNHPDKGGNYDIFQNVSSCNDMINKEGFCKPSSSTVPSQPEQFPSEPFQFPFPSAPLTITDRDLSLSVYTPPQLMQSTPKKPSGWPKSEDWPLPIGVYIVRVAEMDPPIYELSNGRKVQAIREEPFTSYLSRAIREEPFTSYSSRAREEPFTSYSSRDNSRIDCPPGTNFRSGYINKYGTLVSGVCYKQPVKHRSPRKRKNKPRCGSGRVRRKGYRTPSGKRVKTKCVKKPIKCSPRKVRRRSFVNKNNTKVKSTCVERRRSRSRK